MATLDQRIKQLRTRIADYQQVEAAQNEQQGAVDLLAEVGSVLDCLNRELQRNAEADRLLITRLETQTQVADVENRQRLWVLMGIVGAIAALMLRIDPSTEYGQQTTSQILDFLMNLVPIVFASLGVAMAVNQRK